MTLNISFVGQVGNLQRVVNPLKGVRKIAKRRLTTGVQDTILPHTETHDV